MSVLGQARNLRFLSINMFFDYWTPDVQEIFLPQLDTLYVTTSSFRDGDLIVLVGWGMPSLKHLYVSTLYSRDDEDLKFFRAHGMSLVSLRFEACIRDVNEVIAFCPRLEALTVDCTQQLPHRLYHSNLAEITVMDVSLHATSAPALTSTLEPLFRVLAENDEMPRLWHIHLDDFSFAQFNETVHDIRTRTVWTVVCLMFAVRGIFFSDMYYSHIFLNSLP